MDPLPPANAYPFPPESGLVEAYDATVGIIARVPTSPTTTRYAVKCAGVMVEDFVLTAHHCVADEIEDETEVLVGFHSELVQGGSFSHRYDYAVKYSNEEDDIAVLVKGPAYPVPGNTYQNAPLVEGYPYAGQSIVTIGHPMLMMYSLATGIVSHPDRDGERGGGDWFQVSADASPGNSGGPVFTRWGEVLGIVSFVATFNGQLQSHLVGAVHTRVLVTALEAAKQ
jgi:S1-C subfamily serine protease